MTSLHSELHSLNYYAAGLGNINVVLCARLCATKVCIKIICLLLFGVWERAPKAQHRRHNAVQMC